MLWSYNEYVWSFFLSFLVAITLLPYAWPRRDVPVSWPFFGLIVSAGLWSLLSCLQVLAVPFSTKVFLSNLRYVPITMVAVSWAWFALAYTGRRVPGGHLSVLFIVPVMTLVMVATNGLHGWMFTETTLSTSGPIPGVARVYGFWFWVHTCYSYALIGGGIVLFVWQGLYGPALYRTQSTLLLLGGTVPLFANIVFLSFPDRFGHIDLTPVAFILSAVFFAWAVFPFRRLDLRFLARASLVEAIPDAVLVLDMENKVIDLNPAARSLFSRADGVVIGKPVTALLPGFEVHDPGADLPERTIKEVTFSVDGVPYCFEVHISAVRRREEQPPEQQVVVFRDITERKQAHQDRERFVEELEAKNTELERFTYTVSHDLKSPLITIRGFLGLLEQDAFEGDQARIEDDVKHIRHAAEAMQQMLDELLALSRIGRVAAPRQPLSLTELAQEAAGLVAGRITERGVVVEVAPAMPVVLVDRLRMVEVFQNLLDNAVKFMGDQPSPRVEVGTREEGGTVVCYVRDNGCGIDPKHHERIFGLFDQLDKTHEGTGIGLTLVRRIVEVHGGRIWVASEGPGHGSTFCFTLGPSREEGAA